MLQIYLFLAAVLFSFFAMIWQKGSAADVLVKLLCIGMAGVGWLLWLGTMGYISVRML